MDESFEILENSVWRNLSPLNISDFVKSVLKLTTGYRSAIQMYITIDVLGEAATLSSM